ncbi:MAG: LPS export ABC transporter periplasmic protein LptC [Rickettsiales bacterium]|nr:LPS export ABC transporter periplasmic protein LptC [Rickettsiales bacterium]
MPVIEKPVNVTTNNRWIRQDTQRLLSSIGRYTRFVLFSKMFLAVLSVLMILTIIILPVINADEEGLRIAFTTVNEKTDSVPVMTNPTFQGVDEKNQPYLITADSAIQQDENTIILSNVQADMLTEEETWLTVRAKGGQINTDAKTLKLTDDVYLFHDQGYEMATESVHVDMNKHIARGVKPVEGFGPLGSIKAEGFVWDHEQRVMRFTNGVTLVIKNDG